MPHPRKATSESVCRSICVGLSLKSPTYWRKSSGFSFEWLRFALQPFLFSVIHFKLLGLAYCVVSYFNSSPFGFWFLFLSLSDTSLPFFLQNERNSLDISLPFFFCGFRPIYSIRQRAPSLMRIRIYKRSSFGLVFSQFLLPSIW